MANNDVCRPDALIRGAMRGDDSVAQRFNTECPRQQRIDTLRELVQRAAANDGHTMTLGNLQVTGDLAHAHLSHLSKTGAHAQPEAKQTSDAHAASADVNDEWQYASTEQAQKAHKVTADLLRGKDVSAQLNDMTPHERRSVMMVVKHDLAERSGDNVSVTKLGEGVDSIRYLTFKTASGEKILLQEDSMGLPKDIQVNAGRSLSHPFGGAVDVYNRAGESGAAVDSPASASLLERLAGTTSLADGNGPLTKAMRGEDLTADEQRQLADLAKNSNGKLQLYKPKGVD